MELEYLKMAWRVPCFKSRWLKDLMLPVQLDAPLDIRSVLSLRTVPAYQLLFLQNMAVTVFISYIQSSSTGYCLLMHDPWNASRKHFQWRVNS